MGSKPALPPSLAASRRRARQLYAVAVVAGVLTIAITAAVVIGTGEAANASLVTGTAAPAVPGGTIRPTPTSVWHTDDRAAGLQPLWIGTVLTWSDHRLVGRDATSGDIRWSYTRKDLAVCDAAQHNGHAYVLFGAEGDCDEISSFDAQTGTRQWFRTLPDTGEGHLTFGATGLVVTYSTSFHAIDLTYNPGVDRFPSVTPTTNICRFTAVTAGTSGILASERCPDGTHLALWGNLAADGKAQRKWRVDTTDGNTAVAATDAAALAWAPATGMLSSFTVAAGADQPAPTLTPATTGPAGPSQMSGDLAVLPLGSYTYVIDGTAVLTALPTTGAPTVDAAGNPTITAADADTVRTFTVQGSATATYKLPADYPAALQQQPRSATTAGAGLIISSPGVSYLR